MYYQFLIIVLSITFLINSNVKAEDTSVVDIDDITFHSDREKKLFYDLKNGLEIDLLELLVFSNPAAVQTDYEKAQRKIDDIYNQIISGRFSKYNEKKKIKTIYKAVHDGMLNKYEYEVDFYEIFKNGEYNCVTASALYGLLLERLQIPFYAKETEIHVFLMVFPESMSYRLESTDPMGGYYKLDNRAKQQFAEYLRDNKTISEEEYLNSSPDELVEEHYYSDKNINLRELTGLQYYNNGISLFNKGQFENALYEFEKAYLLYPGEHISYYIYNSLVSALQQIDFKDTNDVHILKRAPRFKQVKKNQIIGEYGQLINMQLYNLGDIELFNTSYNILQRNLKDDSLKAEINFWFNLESSRYYVTKGQFDKGFEYAERALDLNNQHAMAQSLFVSCLSQELMNKTFNEVLEDLEGYYNEYPTLQSNNLYLNLMASGFLGNAHDNYRLEKQKTAEKYMNRFYQTLNSIDDLIVEEQLIGETFAAAAVYYFRKGNSTKAKNIIEKGLEISPNNFKLMMIRNNF